MEHYKNALHAHGIKLRGELMTDTELVAHLRELTEKASTGPWKASIKEHSGDNWPITYSLGTSSIDGKDYHVSTDGVHCSEFDGDAKTDAEFIAAARNSLPALLVLLDKERQRVTELEQELAASNERNHKTICSYCGIVQDKPEPWSKDAYVEQILAHLENCPTHPMNLFYAAEARAARAEQATKDAQAVRDIYLGKYEEWRPRAEAAESALVAEREPSGEREEVSDRCFQCSVRQ